MKNVKQIRIQLRQRGVALVEFALTMLFLGVLMMLFWEFVTIMLTHQKATYASYIGERSRVVGGDVNRAVQATGGGQVTANPSGTEVAHVLDLPLSIINPFADQDDILFPSYQHQDFRVARKVTMPTEPADIGDNMYSPFLALGGTMEYPQFPVPIGGYITTPGGNLNPNPNPPVNPPPVQPPVEPPVKPPVPCAGLNCPPVEPPINPCVGVDCPTPPPVKPPIGPPGVCPVNESSAQGMKVASRQAGNPIDVTTGNKYQREVDIRYGDDIYQGWNDSGVLPQLQGQSYSTPLPILWSRHYNSLDETVGVLGTGWRHSYETTLSVKSNRLPVEQDETLYLQQSDGRWIQFDRTSINDHQLVYRADSRDDGWLSVDNTNYRWFWQDGRELLFNKLGQLTRIAAPNGDVQRLYYNHDQRLVSVGDSYGREFSLTYNTQGRLHKIVAVDGETIRYGYSSFGQLVNVTYTDNTQKIYHYEDSRDRYNLTGITDERGIRFSTYQYDAFDRATMSTHAQNVNKVTLSYKQNQQTEVTDSLGRKSTYSWIAMGLNRLVTEVKGPGCSSCGIGDVVFEYNVHQQTTKKATQDGITHTYGYDELGRRTKINQHSRLDHTRLIARYGYMQPLSFQPIDTMPIYVERPSVNPGAFHRHDFEYNVEAQLTNVKEMGFRPEVNDDSSVSYIPIQRTITYGYNKQGQLIEIDGPREGVADTTTLIYYPSPENVNLGKGRLHQVVAADGTISYQVNEYDAAGRVLIDLRNELITTHYQFDPRGRVKNIAESGDETQITYDESGNIIEIADNRNQIILHDYDDNQRKVSSQYPLVTINYIYDTENQLISETYSDKVSDRINTTGYRYDAFGAVTYTDFPGDQSIKMDYNIYRDLITSTTNGVQIDNWQFDEWGNQVIQTQNGETAEYSYDHLFNIQSITDPLGNTTRYYQDDFGFLNYEHSADTGLIRHQYDLAGNQTAVADAQGRSVNYDYDAVSRLTSQKSKDRAYEYTYDKTGVRQIDQTDLLGKYVETLSQDNYGRITTHQWDYNGFKFQADYDYGQELLKGERYSHGIELEYEYSDKDELKSIWINTGAQRQVLVENIKENDAYLEFQLGNDITTRYNYNEEGAVAALNAESVIGLEYEYDAMLNRISQTSASGVSSNYQYNIQNRLVSAKQGKRLYDYSYDAVGNRTKSSAYIGNDLVTQQVFDYPALSLGMRLLSLENQEGQTRVKSNYDYDLSGNLIKSDNQQLSYDGYGQLMKINQDGNSYQYGYDDQGQRIIKTDKQGNTRYFVYENERMIAELDQSFELIYFYVNWKGHAIARVNAKHEIEYLHYDGSEMPIAITDESGNQIYSRDYDPYGNIINESGTVELNALYPGQYLDRETGLAYNHNRYYDPQTGRYISSDPIGLAGGLNRYAYVGGNPVNYYDETGTIAWVPVIVIGGRIAIAGWKAYKNAKKARKAWQKSCNTIFKAYKAACLIGCNTSSCKKGKASLVGVRTCFEGRKMYTQTLKCERVEKNQVIAITQGNFNKEKERMKDAEKRFLGFVAKLVFKCYVPAQ